MPRLKICPTNDNQWYWELVSSTGEVLCYSAKYASKKSAMNAAEVCQHIAPDAIIMSEACMG